MIRSFIDRFNEEEGKALLCGKSAGAVAIVVFLAIVLLNTAGCTKNNTENETANINSEIPKETVNFVDDGENAAIAGDDVSVVTEQPVKSNGMVVMSLENVGRSDPFLPEFEKVTVKPKPKYDFDLLPPPESITVDTTATEVMSTKVSGIMYDRFNPSAILNIGGADYLVRTGDVINSYKVLSIAKESVTVQNGANVYKAGVGEMFTNDGINFNTISNLDSKFGGRKNSANKN